ncbi:hypothetical protein BC829DRAFT_264810 [Chytridium lagenaria]|nr:hypothetical protein BC829DRAFT_264810 [Chytridium lagenaria]
MGHATATHFYPSPKATDPRQLMIKKLEEIKVAKSRGQSMVLFTRENLIALFKIYDVIGKGCISLDQYESAMKNIGAVNYNGNPLGADANRIQQDTFVGQRVSERSINCCLIRKGWLH